MKFFTSNPASCVFKIKDILQFKELFHDFFEYYPYYNNDDTILFEEIVEFLLKEKFYSLKRDETLFTKFLQFLKKIHPDVPSLSIKELDTKQNKIFTLEIQNL